MNIINTQEVMNKLSISRTTLWRLINDPKEEFPHKVSIYKGKFGWIEKDIEEWIKGRVNNN